MAGAAPPHRDRRQPSPARRQRARAPRSKLSPGGTPRLSLRIKSWLLTPPNIANKKKAAGDEENAAGARYNLASSLACLEWWAEARPLYEEALEGRRAELGDRHPDTLSSINNLGMLLQDLGKLEDAEPLLRRALEGTDAALGKSHPSTLLSLIHI
mgnify:CR=1 FL=1